MKSPIKKILLILSSLALISCGGSDNKAKTSSTGSNTGSETQFSGNGSGTVNQGNIPAAVSSLASSLSQSLQCSNGRLTNFLQYYVQSTNSSTRVCGNFQAGVMPGTVGQKYVGVSPYNDFMIITEVVNNNQVIGHNVVISMCAQKMNYYNYQLPLIGDERQLSNFQAPNCIILDKDNYCPHGVVDAAINTYMVSSSYQFNVNGMSGNLNPYEVWTTFFKPTCNGQF